MACLLLLVVLLALPMLTGLRGCTCLAVGDKRHLIFECAALASFMSWYADLATGSTDTMKSFVAQPGHIYFYYMGVLQHVADCLSDCAFYEDLNMMPNLAQLISLVGWLKLKNYYSSSSSSSAGC